MRRVIVLGRGGAGKSMFALRLGKLTGLPVTELDQLFWSADLRPMSRDLWENVQRELAASGTWILDGDLGPYDSLPPRVARADTVVIFDFSALRCAWRVVRRSRERADFWWWLFTWRRRSRPRVLAVVDRWAPGADVHVLRSPHDVDRFLTSVTTGSH